MDGPDGRTDRCHGQKSDVDFQSQEKKSQKKLSKGCMMQKAKP